MYKSIIDNLKDEEIRKYAEKSNSFREFTKNIGYSQEKVGKNTRQKIKERLNKLNIQFKNKEELRKENFEKLNLTTEELGFIGEIALMNLATKKGIHVLKPLIDAYPYDIVLEKNGKFLKFQVKATETYDGLTANFHLASNPHNGAGKKYSKEDVDYFYLYNIILKEGYILKNTESSSSICIRYKSSFKRTDMNFSKNYLAENIIDNIF